MLNEFMVSKTVIESSILEYSIINGSCMPLLVDLSIRVFRNHMYLNQMKLNLPHFCSFTPALKNKRYLMKSFGQWRINRPR